MSLRPNFSFSFDQELLKTQHYAKFENNQNSAAATNQSSDIGVGEMATVSSIASFPTATPSWRGSVDTDGNRVHSAHSFSEVELFGTNESIHQTTVLLDTGAFSNCISKSLWEKTRLRSQTGKHPGAVRLRLGNDTFVTSTLGVKLKWRFKNKPDVYHFYFYIVPDLAHDLILCGPSIFKHEFLRSNPEVCALYLKGDLLTEFEEKLSYLSPLGLPRLRSSKQ